MVHFGRTIRLPCLLEQDQGVTVPKGLDRNRLLFHHVTSRCANAYVACKVLAEWFCREARYDNPRSANMVTSNSPSWSQRYGERHRQHRITEFPHGIDPPQKVRLYQRRDHYVLQAWDPSQRRTISDRVDGDLLDALTRARQIDDRIINYRRSGISRGRSNHGELVARYLAELQQRADAGEISPQTVARYGSALQHYLGFVRSAGLAESQGIHQINREFQLRLAAYLRSVSVSRNGHPQGPRQPLTRGDYVLDVVRGMYRWATDPQRGNLLGDGFLDPFVGHRPRRAERDPLEEPAITQRMAVAFLRACDDWQRPVFAALLLWGLRPSELGWIFRENCTTEFIAIKSLPDLQYLTKGRRDKRIPLLAELQSLWPADGDAKPCGLLFQRRNAAASTRAALPQCVATFREQSRDIKSAAERQRIRDRLQRAAGGVDYDVLEREFRQVTRQLDWPATATMKGFRHLFATSLENSGMPEFYRRYLMGHSNGRSAIVTYTHLNQLREQYARAIKVAFSDVLAVVLPKTP